MTDQQIVPLEIPRDYNQRPLVITPRGGAPKPYTRCTTYISGIDDKFALSQWQQRMVAVGLATDPELLAEVRQSDLSDSAGLNRACDRASFVAGGHDSRNLGTYLHSVTEAYDRGQDPTAVPLPALSTDRTRAEFEPDLAAYVRATKGLEWTHIEEFMVHDALQIGGTPDRIVKIDGKSYIADLKTGKVSLGSLGIASQLAVYARSMLYDWRAAAPLGDRATLEEARALRAHPIPDMDYTKGLVIHLPQGEGVCTLSWVDLLRGWDAVRVCRDIREQRRVTYRHLFSPAMDVLAEHLAQPDEVIDLATAVANAASKDELTQLWQANEDRWSDELTALAKQRLASL